MKLLHNYVSLGVIALLSEGRLRAALRADIDPAVFADVLGKGGGGGVALERLKPYLLEQDPSSLKFFMSNAEKDLSYYNTMARKPARRATSARPCWTPHAQAVKQGGGERCPSWCRCCRKARRADRRRERSPRPAPARRAAAAAARFPPPAAATRPPRRRRSSACHSARRPSRPADHAAHLVSQVGQAVQQSHQPHPVHVRQDGRGQRDAAGPDDAAHGRRQVQLPVRAHHHQREKPRPRTQ